jgi:RNA polymerase sigma factor (sigma-70 family)
MGRGTLQSSDPTGTRADRAADREEDARLVTALRTGDETAFGALYDRWFDRVFDLCRHIVRDAETARETTQDTFLVAWRGLPELRDPASFGGWLLRIARNRALNRHDREKRSRSVDDMGTVVAAAPSTGPAGFTAADRARDATEPEQVAHDAELVALVDDAAVVLGPRDATVLDLQLRYGLEPAELAGALGVSHNAAKQVVHRVRRRLGDAIKARVLWRGGSPRCDDLREALADAGIVSFDADAARAINRHASACDACTQRQQTRLSPAALFSGVPVVVAPVLLKQKTALALEGSGVPMSGSETSGGSDGGAGDGGAGDGHGPSLGRRLLRVAVPAGVAATIVVGVTILAAATVGELDGNDDSRVGGVSASSTTTTASTTTTTTTPSAAVADETTLPSLATTTTTAPPGGPSPGAAPDAQPGFPAFPPPAQPPPPPPPPPPSIVSFTVPERAPSQYFMTNAPRVIWTVTSGAGSVSVSGPGLPPSSAFSGDVGVCPGVLSGPECFRAQGTHVYTLIVRDQNGAEVARESRTLTIR